MIERLPDNDRTDIDDSSSIGHLSTRDPYWDSVEDLFHRTIAMPPAERSSFLADASAADVQIRRCVDRLVNHHPCDGGFMDPPDGLLAGGNGDGPLPSGGRIGSFTLVRVIGSGGNGTVYEAVQDHPQRSVALKVLRVGSTSPRAIKRFEFELQALARLRHPAIAKVYQAGTHRDGAAGVPYFAMEHVPDARNLIRYADGQMLDVRDRLKLFVEICDAVHHGHQRGIIHRDLKPGNILVDASGQPKVIDFGIARAIDSDAAAGTVHTDVGQLMGTLPYMSPEQCTADPDELDIRSDIYTLGVVLYELLSGRLPYDVRHKPIPESVRIIQNDPPARLSIQRADLEGDIETITIKALQKDRDRRYSSAADLAADIRRFLNNQPIEARPPSWPYQLRLFARRNRPLVFAGSAVLVMLITSVILITNYAFQATYAARGEAAQRGKAERIAAFLQDTLVAVNPRRAGGDASVLKMLEDAVRRVETELHDQPEIEAGVRFAIGKTYASLWRWNDAQPHLWIALELNRRVHGLEHPDVARCLSALTEVLTYAHSCTGLDIADQSLRLHRKLYGDADPRVTDCIRDLGNAYLGCSVPPLPVADAERLFQEASERYDRQGAGSALGRARCRHFVAALREYEKRYDEADAIFKEVLPAYRSALGEDHPYVAECLDNYARVLHTMGRYTESELMLADAMRMTGELVGGGWTPFSYMRRMAILQHANRDYATAEESYVRSVVLYCRAITATMPGAGEDFESFANLFAAPGPAEQLRPHYSQVFRALRRKFVELGNSPETASYMTNVAELLLDAGAPEIAEPMLRDAMTIVSDAVRRTVIQRDHWLRADLRSAIGECMVRRGMPERGERFLIEGMNGVELGLGKNHWRSRVARERVVQLYESWGKPDQAQAYRVGQGTDLVNVPPTEPDSMLETYRPQIVIAE
ncbi:MAG: serine/threonine protein kinase [Phycisphaerales bacterium]|nr:serine/threonine protein kinase [Phycisphaerales bacterium]